MKNKYGDDFTIRGWLWGSWYRFYSRLAHRFNWHHATVCYLDTGDIQDWCQWCGLRMNRINYNRAITDTLIDTKKGALRKALEGESKYDMRGKR